MMWKRITPGDNKIATAVSRANDDKRNDKLDRFFDSTYVGTPIELNIYFCAITYCNTGKGGQNKEKKGTNNSGEINIEPLRDKWYRERCFILDPTLNFNGNENRTSRNPRVAYENINNVTEMSERRNEEKSTRR